MFSRVRVLLVEDIVDEPLLVADRLLRAFSQLQLSSATDWDCFAERLATLDFDLALIDSGLTWSNPVQIIETIREQCPDCGTILITRRADPAHSPVPVNGDLSGIILQEADRLDDLPNLVRSILPADSCDRQCPPPDDLSLFHRVPLGLYRSSSQGKLLAANPALVWMLGYPDEETLLATTLSELCADPDDLEQLGQQLERGDVVTDVSNRLRRWDGRTIWVSITIQAVRSSDGQILYYEGTVEDITARRGAEEALQASEERLRALLDNSLDAITMLGPDGTILYASPATAGILGYMPEEVVNINGFDLIHPDDVSYAASLLALLIQQPRTRVIGEFRLQHKDGSWRWIEGIASNLIPDESVRAIVGNFRDVSERKAAEEALRQERGFVSAVLDTVGALIVVLDSDGRIVRFNQTCERTIGYSIEEIQGRPFWDLFLIPEEVDIAKGSFQALLEGQARSNVEFHLVARQAERRLISWTNTTLTDQAGEVEYIICTGIDITARRRVETHLRLLETAVQQANDAVIVTTAEQNQNRPEVVFANQAFTEMTRDAAAEVSDHPFNILATCTDDGQVLERMRDCLARGEEFLGETVFYEAGEEETYLEWHVAPIYNDYRYLTHYIAILRDITERKQSEAALREADRRALKEYGLLLGRLTNLAESVGTARDLRTVFRALLDFVLVSAPSAGMLVSLYDPEQQERSFVYSWREGQEEDVSNLPPFPMSASPNSRAVRSGQVIITNEPDGDPPHWIENPHEDTRPFRSSVAVPMSVLGEVIGAFEVRSTEPNAYQQEHITALQMAANFAAIAVHNTQWFTEATRRLKYLRALRRIDMTITTSLDLQLTLDVLLEQARSQLNVDAAAVLLLSSPDKNLQYAAGHGFHTDIVNHVRLRLGDGLAGRAALERRRIAIPNLAAAQGDTMDPEFLRLISSESFASYHAVPLVAKGEVKGVLELFHRSPLEPDTEWLNFMELLAGQAAIAIDNLQLLENLQRSNTQLALAYDATIEGWSRALDLRDKQTEGHSSRVTEVTVRLAQAMGLSNEQLVHVRRGALLHDIGKMGIPDEILLKPGPLTEEEWAIMHRHPEYGYNLLMPIHFLRPALDIPYCHHEKWDGTGYPRGLQGKEIPLAARIFAVVDVWDALRADRPYRKAWSKEEVLDYLRAQAGTHFDPEVVESFLNLDLDF